MTVIRCSTLQDSQDYIITKNGTESQVTPQEAQKTFDECLKDGLLVYPLVSGQGVWCATNNANGDGHKLPKGLERWKA